MDVVSACLAVLGKRSLDTLLASSETCDNSVSYKEISMNVAKRQATRKEKKINEPKTVSDDKHRMIYPISATRFNGLSCGGMEWGQKEWMNFVQDLLLFLHDNDQKRGQEKLFLDQLEQLPIDFGNEIGVYCFPVKGLIVPSGNADGKIWKPSQGARETGSCMVKRYYYHKDQNENQIKRQISWIRNFGDYTFFDYRSNFKGKVKLNQLMGPVNWPLLVELVNQYVEKRKKENPSPPSITKLIYPTVQVLQKASVCAPNMAKYDPFTEPDYDLDVSLALLQWNWDGLNGMNFNQPIAAFGSQ
eukprot:TRINITY_DN1153_c0_g1_i1.p1 TRINITY_DN1153_c0_g1~~TRINITY_DN1153_c0_g1_i1.p1  ORF type:complete len:302 (-),score=81.04 TRINITY_DN1153_c0_g1_i1:159-1064(-)